MAPEGAMNLLMKRYMDRGNADEVNYADFCNDIDTAEDIFGVGRDYNHSFEYFPKTQSRLTAVDVMRHTPEDVEDCLARLRRICKE